MKTELREEVSGHSSVSDMESDSDSPTEVNLIAIFYHTYVKERKTTVNTELSNIIRCLKTLISTLNFLLLKHTEMNWVVWSLIIIIVCISVVTLL